MKKIRIKRITALLLAALIAAFAFPIPAGAALLGGFNVDEGIIRNGEVYFRGWALLSEGEIDCFGYRIDDGEPLFDESFQADRPDVWQAFDIEKNTGNGFSITADVSSLPDEHDFTILLRAADGTVMDVKTYKFTDGTEGDKSPRLDMCHYDTASCEEDTLKLRGWVVVAHDTVEDLGYRLDDGEPVFSISEDRPDVPAHFAIDPSLTGGFDLTLDISVFSEEEEHVIHVVVKTSSGALFDVNESFDGFEFTGTKPVALSERPTPPAAARGSRETLVGAAYGAFVGACISAGRETVPDETPAHIMNRTEKIKDVKTWTLNEGERNVAVVYCVTEPDSEVYVCDPDGNVLIKERALDIYFYGRYILPEGTESQKVYLYAKSGEKSLSENSRPVILKYKDNVGANAMIGHNSRVYLNWYRDFYVGNAVIQGDAQTYMAGVKGYLHNQLAEIRKVTGKNTKIIIVVCTNPATIHHDMLFDESEGGWGDYSCETSVTQFGEFMKDDGDIYFLDLRRILDEHKDRLLFMQADSHWTQLGAYYGYYSAAQKIKLDFPNTVVYDIDKDFETRIVKSGGDLLTANFMNVPVGVAAVTAEVTRKSDDMLAGPDAPSAYIMGDSYMGAISAYFDVMFGQTYFNVSETGSRLYDYTLEDLQTKKPDYLFYVWTERNVDASLTMLMHAVNAANMK